MAVSIGSYCSRQSGGETVLDNAISELVAAAAEQGKSYSKSQTSEIKASMIEAGANAEPSTMLDAICTKLIAEAGAAN